MTKATGIAADFATPSAALAEWVKENVDRPAVRIIYFAGPEAELPSQFPHHTVFHEDMVVSPQKGFFPVLLIPQSPSRGDEAGPGPLWDVHSLKSEYEAQRTRPEYRDGTAYLADIGSFIGHVARFATAQTAIFANDDPAKPSILAVLDYHPAVNDAGGPDQPAQEVLPAAQRHRSFYQFPLSDEWKAWKAQDNKPMSQGDFAVFLEDRVMDVIHPPSEDEAAQGGSLVDLAKTLNGTFAGPSKLMELSRNLAVNVATAVKQAVNLSSGEISVVYDEQHKDGEGAPIKVPNLFIIGVPIFKGESAYKVMVRLRYRIVSGKVVWSYNLFRTDAIFADAFNGALKRVEEETHLPVFIGTPEPAWKK